MVTYISKCILKVPKDSKEGIELRTMGILRTIAPKEDSGNAENNAENNGPQGEQWEC